MFIQSKSLLCLALLHLIKFIESLEAPNVARLLIVTATSDPNHEAFVRFNRSVEAFGLDLIVLGTREQWRRQETPVADLRRPGREEPPELTVAGLAKIDLLKEALKTYRNEEDLLILWVQEPNNLIVNGDRKSIVQRFDEYSKLNQRILVPATSELPGEKPASAPAGVIIGFANYVWNLLASYGPNSATEAFSEGARRQKFAVAFDQNAKLFQNLDLIRSESELKISFKQEFNSSSNSTKETGSAVLENTIHRSQPVVVFAGGKRAMGKIALNSLGNYLGKAWTPAGGCRDCSRSRIELPADYSQANAKAFPLVLVGVFIERPTPFLEDFFESLLLLNYPRQRIHLFVHNFVADYHDGHVREFLVARGADYASVEVIARNHSRVNLEHKARSYAIERCVELKCDYYLSLDSVARLDEPDTLRTLISANKTLIAPLLVRPTKLWSNFWGSLNQFGYYARSPDYVELVKRERLGLWNVAHLADAYLIKSELFASLASKGAIDYYHDRRFPAMKPIYAFSELLRKANTFMWLMNDQLDFGHLVDNTNYNISLRHPDLHQLTQNILDWEQRYLHDNYSQVLEDDYKLEQPCQDVFWFPLVNELFCDQMIETMEHFGRWSGGTNHDPRIEGGYESVPTRDIHLKQVGLHEMWLFFLREYVMPVQLKEFIGYDHDPPQAELAFVVRYHPAEQASLQPHHDSSTYTMNIALNEPGRDYQGGGCKFVRYNCSVTDSRRGWALIHPGRLTHYHEGLTVTSGTRYILVTFIDP